MLGFLSDSGHTRAIVHFGIANRAGGENVPGVPVRHAQPAILRIWQEDRELRVIRNGIDQHGDTSLKFLM